MSDSIIVAGHLCLDIHPGFENLLEGQFHHLFKPGRIFQVGPARFCTGGPVSNTGLALHHLGVPVKLIGKVGNDPFGQIVNELISQRCPSLVERITMDADAVTSYSVILSPPELDRIILHCTGANDTFTSKDLDYDLIRQSALFHFGYPSLMRQMFINQGKETVEMMRQVKSYNTTTSMDMSFPDPASEAGKTDWNTFFRQVLPYVDIFLPSFEEILFMLHRDTYEEMAAKGEVVDQVSPDHLHRISQELLDMGTRIVVLKCGSRGLYLRTGDQALIQGLGNSRPKHWHDWVNRELWAPCYKVDVAGATGSGDSTIAGFLCAFLRGMLPEQAVNMGTAVGACNVEQADALSGLLSWEETSDRVASGWERHTLKISDPGWHWSPDHQLWFRKLS